MFFSVELFSKRDSGFGLLWLAATLGSKSSFRKLPKRSVMDADITHLCNQISHPTEPLALRLSSNLMVGVARVYKVKHDIFVTEVNNCFILLKRALQDMHTLDGSGSAQLQMGQPTMRPDTLTLTADPTVAIALEFDALNYWNDPADLDGPEIGDGDDEDYNPNARKNRKRTRHSIQPETARAMQHTLDDFHEHLLLSTSFEGNNSLLGFDHSSSQIGPVTGAGSFIIDDGLFAEDGGLGGLADIGEDLARELGEGWGVDIGANQGVQDDGLDRRSTVFGDVDFNAGFSDNVGDFFEGINAPPSGYQADKNSRKRTRDGIDKENQPPSIIEQIDDGIFENSLLVSKMSTPMGDELIGDQKTVLDGPHPKRQKKIRVLLDGRIELSDEELKASRENYLQRQGAIKRAQEHKRMEKDGTRAIDEMLWGPPTGFGAPELVEFWMSMIKSQAQTKMATMFTEGNGPSRRRRSETRGKRAVQEDEAREANAFGQNWEPMDIDQIEGPFDEHKGGQLRSSEEPERGRHNSSHLFDYPGNDLALDIDYPGLASGGTQPSAFFPWDGAGISSSVAGGRVPSQTGGMSDRVSFRSVDVRLGEPPSSSSRGRRRDTPVLNSIAGSLVGIDENNLGEDLPEDDFRFNEGAKDTQDSALNLVTLERNAFNFLEYCKIQRNTQHGPLNLGDVVPVGTSTRRVAATALYNCLVLATKDLVVVKQSKPYGRITILLKA